MFSCGQRPGSRPFRCGGWALWRGWFPVRHATAHLRRRPVLPQTFVHNLAKQILFQVRYLTSATSSGRVQWTRLKTSGEPGFLISVAELEVHQLSLVLAPCCLVPIEA